MITESFIPEKLQSFDYYLYKLPLYLQNSPTFKEHFRIWYDLLMGEGGINENSIVLINLLNIFDDDYLDYINNLEGAKDGNDEYTVSDILDKIGALFGVTRKFRLTYYDETLHTNELIELNNQEFLILIKAKIIQNNYDGTNTTANEYYHSANLNMYMITNGTVAATADIYLMRSDSTMYVYTENIRKLFLADLLTIKAMGINYRKAILSNVVFTWDVTNWDEGDWSI